MLSRIFNTIDTNTTAYSVARYDPTAPLKVRAVILAHKIELFAINYAVFKDVVVCYYRVISQWRQPIRLQSIMLPHSPTASQC